MIVTTGKSIRIEAVSFHFKRSCETPGVVDVQNGTGLITLPASAIERETFIAAYRRACEEDIPYRKRETETPLLSDPEPKKPFVLTDDGRRDAQDALICLAYLQEPTNSSDRL